MPIPGAHDGKDGRCLFRQLMWRRCEFMDQHLSKMSLLKRQV